MGLSDPQCCSSVGEHCALGNAMLRGDGIAPLGIDKLADRHALGGLGVSFGWLGLLLARGVRWLGLIVRICGTASDERSEERRVGKECGARGKGRHIRENKDRTKRKR